MAVVWKQSDKDRITGGFKKICIALRLWPCLITYNFLDEPEINGELESLAKIDYAYPYDKITLDCYPAMIESSDIELSYDLWHEAFHAVLAPLDKNRLHADKLYEEIEETVCERLSHCLGYDVFE